MLKREGVCVYVCVCVGGRCSCVCERVCLYEREDTLANERVCERQCGFVQVHGVGGVAMVDTSEKDWSGAVFVG